MKHFAVDWKPFVAIGAVLLVMAGVVAVWTVQGRNMRGHFIEAVRSGEAGASDYELRTKTWSDEELATVEVLKLPGGTGPQRAITRSLQTRGRDAISRLEYSYQASIRDNNTGIVHVFGYQRRDPQHWRWVTIHPDSREIHLRRRMKQVEEMRAER